jgi:hypothetical protein
MKLVEPLATMIIDEKEKMVVDSDFEENFGHLFLARLFSTRNKEYDLETLIQIGNNINLLLQDSDIKAVESNTKSQSNNSLWFKLRIGRVTASVFKNVCRTSVENPSKSLLKKMFFPDTEVLKVKAVEYGRKTEEVALKKLKSVCKKNHKNLKIDKIGLVIIQDNPYYAASPDAIWTCECHGKMCVEVKCPLRIKDSDELQILLDSKSPFIYKNSTGEIEMHKSHSYYYQVQLQMHVLNLKKSVFYIYSKKVQLNLVVDYDGDFMKEALIKSDNFIKFVLKPQLLSNYFYDPIDD